MCTYQTREAWPLSGSGKGPAGWFRVSTATVYFDHPVHAPADHTLNIDFLAPSSGRARGWPSSSTAGLGPRARRGHPGRRGHGRGGGPAYRKLWRVNDLDDPWLTGVVRDAFSPLVAGTAGHWRRSAVARERTATWVSGASVTSGFHIGSVTKTFTALLLATMASSGRGRAGRPCQPLPARASGSPTRLVDLATHTSGYPRIPPRSRYACCCGCGTPTPGCGTATSTAPYAG